jgi:hypothetical protein
MVKNKIFYVVDGMATPAARCTALQNFFVKHYWLGRKYWPKDAVFLYTKGLR